MGRPAGYSHTLETRAKMSQAQRARRPRDLDGSERFMARVQKTDSCWFWIGGCTANGYGAIWYDGRQISAHRFALMREGHVIPDGDHVHHECGERRCVRPDHLRIIDGREHVRAHGFRDTCIHGHSLTDPANARLKPNGWRRCLACEKRRKGKG
jgi:hypothetical protein